MKIAVISDIHSNLYALMNVLNDIDDERVDSIICLGDLVGYGPHPNEVVSLIQRKNIISLKGNYDASVVDNDFTYIRNTTTNSFSLPWTAEELRAVNRNYLDNLPSSLTLEFNNKKIKFVHGSPNTINEYLLEDGENTKEIMSSLQEDVLVCAHTHLPSYKNFGNKIFINSGSVGKPKIGRPNSTYMIIDISKDGNITPKLKEVEYELSGLIRDMEMLNFPHSLIQSFKDGKEN